MPYCLCQLPFCQGVIGAEIPIARIVIYSFRIYIDNAQFLERSIALDQQLREKKKFLSKRTTDNSFERVLFQTRSIQQQLGSSPPLETFDGTIFTKLVNRVQVSPTTIEFKFMNGMTLSEKRSSL